MDIVYLIDASDQTSFQDQINFFINLTHDIYVGPDDANIAAVLMYGYSHMTYGNIVFNLTTHLTSQDVQYALSGLTYPWITGSYQYFEHGIRVAFEDVLMANKRNDSEAIIIAATRDSYTLSNNAIQVVESARNSSTRIITIGISQNVAGAATVPAYFFQVWSSSEIYTWEPFVINLLCPSKIYFMLIVCVWKQYVKGLTKFT